MTEEKGGASRRQTQEHTTRLRARGEICDMSYDNDHKDGDIQPRTTEEGVLSSRPHRPQHVHIFVRKHSDTTLDPLGQRT